jgi:hypothetical protein
MAKVKLPYNEWVEVSKELALKIQKALDDRAPGDTPIKLSPTRTIRLRKIDAVETEDTPQYQGEKVDTYDIHKDRKFLLDWATGEVEMHGTFEDYCIAKQYLIPSRAGHGILAVNADKHTLYTDALERWNKVKQILDATMQREEKQEGMELLRQLLIEKKVVKH